MRCREVFPHGNNCNPGVLWVLGLDGTRALDWVLAAGVGFGRPYGDLTDIRFRNPSVELRLLRAGS